MNEHDIYNQHHSSNKPQKRRLTPTEEKKISIALQNVWQETIQSLRGSMPRQELLLVDRLFGRSDTYCGIGAGLVSFVCLRGMRARVLPRLLSNKASSSRFTVQHSPFRPFSLPRKHFFSRPWQADLVGESSKWKLLDLCLDSSASTCLGMTVYLWRRVETLKQISEFPLQHPSLAVSREVCPKLHQELARWHRNLQQDKLLSSYSLLELHRQNQVQDVYLRCLLQFSSHCE